MPPLVPSLHPKDTVKLLLQQTKDTVFAANTIRYEHTSVSVCRPSFALCIRNATVALGTRPPVVLRSQGKGEVQTQETSIACKDPQDTLVRLRTPYFTASTLVPRWCSLKSRVPVPGSRQVIERASRSENFVRL
ncbi:unnamed protein product [Ixodes pacificus]